MTRLAAITSLRTRWLASLAAAFFAGASVLLVAIAIFGVGLLSAFLGDVTHTTNIANRDALRAVAAKRPPVNECVIVGQRGLCVVTSKGRTDYWDMDLSTSTWRCLTCATASTK